MVFNNTKIKHISDLSSLSLSKLKVFNLSENAKYNLIMVYLTRFGKDSIRIEMQKNKDSEKIPSGIEIQKKKSEINRLWIEIWHCFGGSFIPMYLEQEDLIIISDLFFLNK